MKASFDDPFKVYDILKMHKSIDFGEIPIR